MTNEEFLKQVANVVKSNIVGDDGMIYVSKFDGSYITHVGMEDQVTFLVDRGITENLQHGVGFSPSQNKWYGWSHRGICGFTVGSIVKKGDVAFCASNLDDELEDAERFWGDEYHEYTKAVLVDEGKIMVEWRYNDKVPNAALRGTLGGTEWNYNPSNFGRGEWVAKTMEDAEQMARDFNRNIS